MRNWLASVRWHDVQNTESEAIPGLAVMQVVGRSTIESGLVMTVGKPDASLESDPQPGLVLINGPTQIAKSGTPAARGAGTQQWPALVQVSGSLAVGDEIGPIEDSWAMTADGSGFVVVALGNVHQLSTAYVSPIRSNGGSTSADFVFVDYVNASATTISSGSQLTYETLTANAVEGTALTVDTGGNLSVTAVSVGWYQVCLSALITSSSSPYGGALIGVNVGLSAPGLIAASRAHVTASVPENVCAFGFLETTSANQVIKCFAASSIGVTLDLRRAQLSIKKVV